MLEERAGCCPLSFSALLGAAGSTCVGRITGSPVSAGSPGRGDDGAVETQAYPLGAPSGRPRAGPGRGGLLCRSRFTLGAGTPSTASAPRVPA